MKLTRRSFNGGVAVIAMIASLPVAVHAETVPPSDALVLARATDIDLSALETAVVLMPVPPPRRPPQRPKLAKGEKPPAVRTWIVLREVVAGDRSPAYDLFLVLEGTNVFAPTTTTQPVGALVFGKAGGDKGAERKETFAFNVTDALAKLSKTRGFNMRYLRLTIVRRAAADKPANAKVVAPSDSGPSDPAPSDPAPSDPAPSDPAPSPPVPPEIGVIELVRW
jgi:hypothetical protein